MNGSMAKSSAEGAIQSARQKKQRDHVGWQQF